MSEDTPGQEHTQEPIAEKPNIPIVGIYDCTMERHINKIYKLSKINTFMMFCTMCVSITFAALIYGNQAQLWHKTNKVVKENQQQIDKAIEQVVSDTITQVKEEKKVEEKENKQASEEVINKLTEITNAAKQAKPKPKK